MEKAGLGQPKMVGRRARDEATAARGKFFPWKGKDFALRLRWVYRGSKCVLVLRQEVSATSRRSEVSPSRERAPSGASRPPAQGGRHGSLRGKISRLATVLAAAIFVFALFQLAEYCLDALRTRRQTAELQQANLLAIQEAAASTVAPELSPPAATASPPRDAGTAAPTATPIAFKIMSPRFAKLKQQNQDIVAWLTIPDQLDTAVVQRDNTYYLNRDYQGYHNVNGAIFLDMNCDLTKDPKALVLYGHNMKTGEMFGNLRKYEEYSYFRTHPTITCDTQYEEGEFLVFAVLRASTVYGSIRFVNYTMYSQMTQEQREETLAALLRLNAFTSPVEVSTEDQLLILSTCTGDDHERLLVCARRARAGETVAQAQP